MTATQNQLCFLKLGGSLITDKGKPFTPRLDTLKRLAGEIAEARVRNPDLRLVLGHGSGSYGHVPARQHGTVNGVSSALEWAGFYEVWKEARTLNELVVDAMISAGLPVMAFPPSSAALTSDHHVAAWDLRPIKRAIQANIIPMVNGDVTFDTKIGGTILSTEEAFVHLAKNLKPQRILLAGIEQGVWMDFPKCSKVIPTITPSSQQQFSTHLGGSVATDVTGGMLQKVTTMIDLVNDLQDLQVSIYSGEEAGITLHALLGANPGTIICSSAVAPSGN